MADHQCSPQVRLVGPGGGRAAVAATLYRPADAPRRPRRRRCVVRGTVIKRGDGYSVVLDLGRGPNGKRIRRWHSGYRTKRDAERARVELLAKLDQGAYIPPSKLTVAAFLVDQWLPSVRAQVKASTWGWHRTNVVNHLVPRVGQVPLQKLSPAHLNEAY